MSSFAERGQEIFNRKPPYKQTQREKIIWTQHNRTSGTWAKCSVPRCQKWRYLKNTFDPVDIPTEWECSMNLDQEYNACSKPQSSEFKDITLVKLKYTAGSLVWVNSARYLRWPGMVDDDPELTQFYWLNALSRDKEASMYHIVFIDKDTSNVSRQWFSEQELEEFTLSNSESVAGKQARLIESVRLAREALKMNIFQRLQRFSFARLFRGHIYSCGHTMRSIVVPARFDIDSDSDCTLLSSYSDEEMDENYNRSGSRCNDYSVTRRRRASSVATDIYSENVTRRRRASSVAPDEYSENGNKRRRAPSVSPSDYSENVTRRRRASSVAPDDYSESRDRRKRATSVFPNDYSKNVPRRRRASSVAPGEYSDSSSKKRRASSTASDNYEFSSKKKRTSAVACNPSERILRSHVRNSFNKEISNIPNASNNKRSKIMLNELFYESGTSFHSEISLPSSYSPPVLNVDIGERGMGGRGVLKLSTTKWKFSVNPGRKKGIPSKKRY